MSDSAARQWTLVIVLTALFLSLVVLAQIVARFSAAYWAAPREIAALLDSADSALQENESYDRDVAKVARLEDKMRLGHLLRQIQRAGDDLREDLNAVLADGPGTALAAPTVTSRLTTTGRLLWAAKRPRLEERLRRLDLLRMRFLVIYMSIVAASATAAAEKVEKSAAAGSFAACTPPLSAAASTASSLPSSPRFRDRDPEKTAAIIAASLAAAASSGIMADGPYDSSPSPQPPPPPPLPPLPPPSTPHTLSPFASPPPLPFDLLESIRRKPPLRQVSRLPRHPADRSHSSDNPHRASWMGVVQELQRSPLLQKRHASLERAMGR